MSQVGQDAEAEWVAHARAGDRGAFDRLIARHAPRLLSLASRLLGPSADADQAVQDALASAWLALRRFDPHRPFGPWLTTITLNKCRDLMRRRRFERWLSIEADPGRIEVADERPSQEQQLADRRLLERLKREIARLPSRLKEPFVLVTFDDRSQGEAAEILGISRKAVELRVRRARSLLRERLERN